LVSSEDLTRVPNLLLQKFPARAFAFETLLEFSPDHPGEEAGLVVMGQSCAALALQRNEAGQQLVLRVDGVQKFARDGVPGPVKLRVEAGKDGVCAFHVATDGQFVRIPHAFSARRGAWMGAKIGVYALNRRSQVSAGHADFDYCRFS
jgi:hypothetical protein